MKSITISDISDKDHARIEAALNKAYNCECCEDAIAHFIKQTVQNIEESELRQAKDEEVEAAMESISEINL